MNDFELSGGGKALLRYNGSDTHVVIPDSVTKIGSVAFSNCMSLKIVIISDEVLY